MVALPESGGHCPGNHRETDPSSCPSKLKLDLEALLKPPNMVCYMGSFTSKDFCLPRWGQTRSKCSVTEQIPTLRFLSLLSLLWQNM